MADQSLAKIFNFPNIIQNFAGYDSCRDKTNINEAYMVLGSQNIYKKLSGNLAVRPGLKRIGDANSAASGVSSEFVWNTSWGTTYPMWVADSKLQVSISNVWYTLLTTTFTRYVFDKWWDNTNKRDLALFVNGNSYIQYWTGGYAMLSSAAASTITKTGTTTWQQEHFDSSSLTTIGSSSTQFDITNPSGTTFRYTWDSTGTDPLISATTVPVGSYILLGAQNFTAANNGLFVVTGSGTNYFEVTNASGVAENNKTIGTGYIYTNFKKVLIISGTAYAYTGGETTTTLTGVTPNPSAITANTVILQAVITIFNSPATSFNNDFIKVINNQAYVGSYTSRLCYISSNTDFTNYVVPSPRSAGDPELLTLDGTLNGIGVRLGNAHIAFGSGSWAEISFTDITVGTTLTQQTKVDVKPVALLQSAYAHEFIDNTGDNIIYLAKDQQVRTIGSSNNSFTTVYPSFSQEIASELSAETFTGGGLRCIGEFIYLTAPNSGKTYLRQERQSVDPNGQVVAERLWHSPFTWGATRIDEINGTVVAFSNSNPQVYQVWDTDQWHDDSPSDEPLPYICMLSFAYRTSGRRQGMTAFDKVFSEGYITQTTPLNLTINYNYQGSLGSNTSVVNSIQRSAYLFTPNASDPDSLGDSSLGEETLGESDDETGSPPLPKFKVINSLPLQNCFEYQLNYWSDTADAQWELLATATNATIDPDQNPTFIINKQR